MISEEGVEACSNSSIDLAANAKLRDAYRVSSNVFTDGTHGSNTNMAGTYASLPITQLDEE